MLTYMYYHRVRYRECDPMRVVYHTHYLDFFEAARTEALRSFGLPYKAVEDAGIVMPVTDVRLKYHGSGLYDDELQIKCLFPEMPTVRIPIDYEVRRMVNGVPEPKLLVEGRVTLCFVDVKRRRPVRIPDMIKSVFESAFLAQ